MKKERGKGYLGYPSPEGEWGVTPLLKWYFIDTTDFCFNQGSVSDGKGVWVASSGAMSTVWLLEAMGTWVCLGVF